MKKLLFSGLIFCGALFVTAQTNAQTFANDGDPIIVSHADHSGLFAYVENNAVILRWSTGNETQIDHFEIERATDTVHFNTLHEVVSRGAIDRDSTYRDMDAYPTASVNYYRLKTILSDGSEVYSDPIRVDTDPRKIPVLKPTAVNMGGIVRLETYPDQPLNVVFFNGGGTVLGTFIVNSSSFDIPTNGWNKGVVFYRISDASHPLISAGKIMIL